MAVALQSVLEALYLGLNQIRFVRRNYNEIVKRETRAYCMPKAL